MKQTYFKESEWEYLLSFMPDKWEEQGRQLGAIKRSRNVNAISMLRLLLIHLLDGSSLRETVVRGKEGGIAKISDVALLKRLNNSGEWFNWLGQELLKKWIKKDAMNNVRTYRRLRLIDGSIVSEPGATGSEWRIHYSIDLKSLKCDEVKITDSKAGEKLSHYNVSQKDILVGDRGYGSRFGVEYVKERGGDVIIRLSTINIPLYNIRGKRINIFEKIKCIKAGEIKEVPVYVKGEKQLIKGRVCVLRKSTIEIERSIKKIKRASARHGVKKIRAMTLESAKYIIVFTTLSRRTMDKNKILEIYRARWQIEVAFKKLKSLIKVGHLPKQDPKGAKAWLQGKIFVALLLETLIIAGESFFPWGYPLDTKVFLERNSIHA